MSSTHDWTATDDAWAAVGETANSQISPVNSAGVHDAGASSAQPDEPSGWEMMGDMLLMKDYGSTDYTKTYKRQLNAVLTILLKMFILTATGMKIHSLVNKKKVTQKRRSVRKKSTRKRTRGVK